jgi:hypothetical protein
MSFSPVAAVVEIVLAFGVIGLGVFGYKKFSKKTKQNHN